MSNNPKPNNQSDKRTLRTRGTTNYSEQDLRKSVLTYSNKKQCSNINDSGYDSRTSDLFEPNTSASRSTENDSEQEELLNNSEDSSVISEDSYYWDNSTLMNSNIEEEELEIQQENNQIIMALNGVALDMQRLSAQMSVLRDVISGIEIYDGKEGLSNFIAECKRSKKDLNQENLETELLRAIVRTKLTRQIRAQLQIPENGYETLQQLFKDLKQLKRGAKTELQLIGEIGLMYQGEKESVREFGKRIREAGILVNDVHNLAPGETADQWSARLTNILQTSFKLGLKAEIGRMLETTNSLTGDILAAAKLEEQEILRTGLRRSNGHYSKADVAHTIEYKEVNKINEIKKCNFCKREGHIESECFKKKNQEKIIKCYSCNRMGHIARDCTNKQQTSVQEVNERQKAPVQCQICKKLYHTADKCFQYKRNENKTIQCRFCKNMGHSIDECRKRMTANSNQGNGQGPSSQNMWGGPNNNQQQNKQHPKRINALMEDSEADEE